MAPTLNAEPRLREIHIIHLINSGRDFSVIYPLVSNGSPNVTNAFVFVIYYCYFNENSEKRRGRRG